MSTDNSYTPNTERKNTISDTAIATVESAKAESKYKTTPEPFPVVLPKLDGDIRLMSLTIFGSCKVLKLM